LLGQRGISKIQQHHPRAALQVDQHVVRVDIAVQDPPRMHVREDPGELQPDLRDLGEAQPVRIGEPAEFHGRHARGAGHGNVGGLGALHIVVEARDARVIEQGEQLRLAPKAVGVIGVRRAEELERDLVAAAAMHRMEDFTPCAGTHHGEPLVAAVEQRRWPMLGVRSADRCQRTAELGGRLRAIAGLERQRRGEDDGQVDRCIADGIDLAERPHRVDARQCAGAQLVEGDPEAVDVEALVRRHQARLHRHIRGCADRHTGVGPSTRRLGRRTGQLVPV
jgi:hypothetical protein